MFHTNTWNADGIGPKNNKFFDPLHNEWIIGDFVMMQMFPNIERKKNCANDSQIQIWIGTKTAFNQLINF